jgi:hypothetical protein
MNQVQAEFLDSDLLKDAEATAQRQSLSEGGEVRTMRLESIAPPPMPVNLVTAALPTLATPAHAPIAPQAALPSLGEGTTRYRSEAPLPGRPSWLRALLVSTFPPPSATSPVDDATVVRRVVGVTCIAVAIVLGLIALVLGLSGAPKDPTLAPPVAAMVVLSRGLFALGAGAFSFGLIRLAERALRGKA